MGEIYEIRDEGVGHFLRSHRQIAPVLIDVAETAPVYFGPDARLAWEMVDDPEDGGDGELFAIVMTSLSPDLILDRLQAFDRGWWFQQLPRVAGQLTATLEYV